MSTYRRKPHRKSILRRDAAREEGRRVEERQIVRSTQLKKDPKKHRQKAELHGRIIGVSSAQWLVEEQSRHATTQEPFSFTHECIVGGLVTSDNPDDETLLAVGDWVEFALAPDDERKGVIVHVQERTSRLFRRSPADREVDVIASNVKRVFFVHSTTQPHFRRRLLDRHLIAAEQGGVEPIVVINKIDLPIPPEVEEAIVFYRDRIGVRMCLTSALTGDGIPELRMLTEGVTSVLVGASGVGKSALLNAYFNMNLQAVRAVSRKYQRGRHTTTNTRLFHLPNGGKLIDTPGLREFALARLEPTELAFYFHDFDPFYPHCKYLPCTHTHEPGCAVQAAVEEGAIDPQRYESYLLIFESLNEQKEQR